MKLKYLPIFLLLIFGGHFGDDAIALLLCPLDDDCDPADLYAPSDHKQFLMG
jgi:hypothetical protein